MLEISSSYFVCLNKCRCSKINFSISEVVCFGEYSSGAIGGTKV
jgi:hypothetical protein